MTKEEFLKQMRSMGQSWANNGEQILAMQAKFAKQVVEHDPLLAAKIRLADEATNEVWTHCVKKFELKKNLDQE